MTADRDLAALIRSKVVHYREETYYTEPDSNLPRVLADAILAAGWRPPIAYEQARYAQWVEALREAGSLWIAKYVPEGSGISFEQEFDSLDRLLDYFEYDSDGATGYPGGNYPHPVYFLEEITRPDGTVIGYQETCEIERRHWSSRRA